MSLRITQVFHSLEVLPCIKAIASAKFFLLPSNYLLFVLFLFSCHDQPGVKLSYSFTYSLFFLQVVPVLLHLLAAISSVRLYIPKDLRSRDSRESVGKSIQV